MVCKNPNNEQSNSKQNKQLTAMHYLAASPPSLSKSIHKVTVNGKQLDALIDTGSSATFLNYDSIQKHGWLLNTTDTSAPIALASSSHVSHSAGVCKVNMCFSNKQFCNQTFTVIKDLCADMIIGLDILGEFSSVTLDMGGRKEPLVTCYCSMQYTQ